MIHVLDDHLKLAKKISIISNRLDSVFFRLIGVTNLISGLSPQIVAVAYHVRLGAGRNMGGDRFSVNVRLFRDAEILVMDTKLKVLAHHSLGEKWTTDPEWTGHLVDMDGDHLPEIVAVGTQDGPVVFKFRN
jgi:hypothetical protein